MILVNGFQIFGSLFLFVFIQKDSCSQSLSIAKAKAKTKTERCKPEKIDEILDKISQSGYASLTKEEKELLFRAGNS